MKEIDDFLSSHGYPHFDLKAVFFDMDGVLFDSMPYHAAAWAKTMQGQGFDFTEYDAYMNEGRTGEATINEQFQRYFQRDATPEECHALYQEKGRYFEACGAVKTIPNIEKVLQHVKSLGLTIFIVTGSAQRSLLDTLNEHFPNIFDKQNMVTAFDVKFGKPNPEPYLMALQKAQLKPYQALVVENAPLGVRSAVDAGIFTVAVNTGIIKDEELWHENANIVLPDMQTLLEKFSQFEPFIQKS